MMPSRMVMAIAHRGASAYAPENTIAAFEEAIHLGCRAVEFDVRVSADGVPVVLHDETVDRTTNGRGRVAELSWTDLLRLDAGSWMHRRFAGVRIPTLEEALRSIGPAGMPVMELKVPVGPEIIGRLLSRHNLTDQTVAMSFEPGWLAPLRREIRDLSIGLLAESWHEALPEQAAELGASVLVLRVDLLNPGRLRAAEDAGLEVWCYTANDVGLVAACAALGVSGVITDRPDLIREKN